MQTLHAWPWLLFTVLLLNSISSSRAIADEAFSRLFSRWQELVVDQGRFNEAVPVANQLLAHAEKTFGSSDLRTAQALHCVAWLEHWQQHYDRARELWERSLECQERMPTKDPVWYSRALVMLANVHRDLYNFPQAEDYAARSLGYRRKSLGDEHPETATALGALSTLQYHFGDYAAAEEGFVAAIAVWEKLAEPEYGRTIALALDRLGRIRHELGDFVTADQHFREALALQERLLAKNHSFIGVTLGDFARNSLRLGRLQEAESSIQRAIEILDLNSEEEPAILHQPLMTLGELRLARGDLDGAEAAIRRTDRNLRRIVGPAYPELGEVLAALAKVSEERQQYPDAIRLHEESLTFLRGAFGPQHPRTIRAMLRLATSKFLVGDREGALALADDLQAAQEAMISHVLGFGSESQRLAFQREFLALGSLDLWASLGAPVPVARGILRSKGVVLDSLMYERRAQESSLDPTSREQFEELRSLKRQLSGLYARSIAADLNADEASASQKRMSQAIARLKTLQDAIARSTRRTGAPSPTISEATAEALANRLPQGTVLIQFLRYHDLSPKNPPTAAYGALVFTRDKIPAWIPLGDAAKCEQEITRYQHAIRERAPDAFFTNVLQALSLQLWSPLERVLADSTKHLILCPDAALNRISFATLLGSKAKLLGERYSIAYAANARDLLVPLRSLPSDAPRGILLLANPDLSQTVQSPNWKHQTQLASLSNISDRNWTTSPLPGTEREARRVATLAKQLGSTTVTLRLGTDASEAALHASQLPDIVHLGAHATFLDAPGSWPSAATTRLPSSSMHLRSDAAMHQGVVLLSRDPRLDAALSTQPDGASKNDGFLTAAELSTLDLSQCSLLVLAGCDTGIAWHDDGDGTFGFRRGAMLAGSQGLILSLWPIDDLQTSDILIDFYSDFLHDRDAAGAFGRAQRKWLTQTKNTHSLADACRLTGGLTLTIQGPP